MESANIVQIGKSGSTCTLQKYYVWLTPAINVKVMRIELYDTLRVTAAD